MTSSEVKRAQDYEDIRPLIELCKAGKLFDVQGWIDAGKPVNPPEYPGRGTRKKTPLEYAVDYGFHSLVEVLLQGGADFNSCCAMERALEKRRFDIVHLLVDHGYDPSTVSMHNVFSTWDPDMMEYFIDHGADVETDMPLAWALCSRIRTALRVFKKYQDKYPSFQEQINVALRHHCREGTLKWVSLLLWAGADPLAPGECEPNVSPDPEDGGLCALGFAALYNHFEVFSLKGIKLQPEHPATRDVFRYCCDREGIGIVEKLLDMGMDPNDQANGGSSEIQYLLQRLDWGTRFSVYSWQRDDNGIDSEKSRICIKVIHLLAKHGGRWSPVDANEINSARRALLKAKPDYTVEFVWIMKKYAASTKEHMEALLRTPTIKRHTTKHRQRLAELLEEWPVNSG